MAESNKRTKEDDIVFSFLFSLRLDPEAKIYIAEYVRNTMISTLDILRVKFTSIFLKKYLLVSTSKS